MTIAEWLKQTETKLSNVGIQTARLDAVVLLADEMQLDKSTLFAYPENILQGSIVKNLNKKVVQRCNFIPLAYIRGHAEFYGREFEVNDSVLVPRPESESIIELLRKTKSEKRQIIIDVGTGSGCLAITAKLEFPDYAVFAIDIDEDALQVARQNAKALQAEISLLQSDILESLQPSTFNLQTSILLANLPYVPSNHPINKAAAHEPALALFSGDDGLDHYRKLFEQAMELAPQPYAIIAESLFTQHKKMSDLATNAGYEQKEVDGLVQLFVLR